MLMAVSYTIVHTSIYGRIDLMSSMYEKNNVQSNEKINFQNNILQHAYLLGIDITRIQTRNLKWRSLHRGTGCYLNTTWAYWARLNGAHVKHKVNEYAIGLKLKQTVLSLTTKWQRKTKEKVAKLLKTFTNALIRLLFFLKVGWV
jgi:hypothetical protein